MTVDRGRLDDGRYQVLGSAVWVNVNDFTYLAFRPAMGDAGSPTDPSPEDS